jgi:hypothetical protein
MDTCTTLVALGLAAAAAIMSAPGHPDMARQMSAWLQSGMRPEAEAIAGAIGQHPDQVVPPDGDPRASAAMQLPVTPARIDDGQHES